ncbi:MAG: response regulator [Nitrospiraceae bacterium]|nr:response regulator [Nitrospiraceae bacterium]
MKKVLIVDDLRTFIDKEKSILDRSDIKIFTATSGGEALAVHKAEKVDLIIVDLDMPGMNGDKFCSIIRRDEVLKRVSIIITCDGTESDIARIRQCKANSYITKPIRPVQFLESVGRFLDVPERKSYRVLLKARVEGKFGNEPFYCSSQNISVSGLLIETEKVLEKGDVLSCSFFLPGSECIVTDAEVMRTVRGAENSMSYGVRFLDLRPSFKAAIATFIEKRSVKS